MNDPVLPLTPPPGVVLTSRDLAVGSRALDVIAENDPTSLGRNASAVAASARFSDTLARVRSAWASVAARASNAVSDFTLDGYMLIPLDLPYDDRLLVATICKAYALDLATMLSMNGGDDEAGDAEFVGELMALAHRLGATP